MRIGWHWRLEKGLPGRYLCRRGPMAKDGVGFVRYDARMTLITLRVSLQRHLKQRATCFGSSASRAIRPQGVRNHGIASQRRDGIAHKITSFI